MIKLLRRPLLRGRSCLRHHHLLLLPQHRPLIPLRTIRLRPPQNRNHHPSNSLRLLLRPRLLIPLGTILLRLPQNRNHHPSNSLRLLLQHPPSIRLKTIRSQNPSNRKKRTTKPRFPPQIWNLRIPLVLTLLPNKLSPANHRVLNLFRRHPPQRPPSILSRTIPYSPKKPPGGSIHLRNHPRNKIKPKCPWKTSLANRLPETWFHHLHRNPISTPSICLNLRTTSAIDQ